MSTIANIPEEMITEHVNWHTKPGDPGGGGRAIEPWPATGPRPAAGSGEEFLVWHKGFIERFHAWVDQLPDNDKPDANAITPWTEIPAGLKMGMVGWNQSHADDEALVADMSNFASLDGLGRMLEWGLHGFFHMASARMWNEPFLLGWESPRSAFFWQLHGLIDHWRQQWVDAQRITVDPRVREMAGFPPQPWPDPWPAPIPPPMPDPWPDPWPWPKPSPRPAPGPRPGPWPGPDPVPDFGRLTTDELRLISALRMTRLR